MVRGPSSSSRRDSKFTALTHPAGSKDNYVKEKLAFLSKIYVWNDCRRQSMWEIFLVVFFTGTAAIVFVRVINQHNK